jgi:membrane protein
VERCVGAKMADYLGGLSWLELGKRAAKESMNDNVLDQAAELAFYFLLSLFPLMIFVISMLGLVTTSSGLENQLIRWLTQAMPSSASGLVTSIVQQTAHRSGSGKLSFGILFALWTASSGMVAVINGLNVAFHIREARSWIKQHLVALWLTAAIGFFMLISVAIILFGSQIVQWLGAHTGLSNYAAVFWQVVQWPVAIFLVMLAFAVVYRYAPNKPKPRWKWVTPGAALGVLLWLAASFGFRLYLVYFNSYSATYGSLGALIVLIMWFYVTGIAILVGGEVDSEIEMAARSRGERISSESPEEFEERPRLRKAS